MDTSIDGQLQQFRRDLQCAKKPVAFTGAGMSVEPEWSHALNYVRDSDLMIQVGTNGTVLPAALLPLAVLENGGKVWTID